ncbi:MAG: hypothetical protein NWF14_03565 [Candidatus Bathyarchaeota archaeon]|nr:hypothetical protein [Candidatus Bathyarchaeota archaeon]
MSKRVGSVIVGCITAYVLQRFFADLIQRYIGGNDPLLVMVIIVFASGFIAGLIEAAISRGAIAGFIAQILPPLFLALEAYMRGSEGLELYLGEYGSWLFYVFTNPGLITTVPFIVASIGGLLGSLITAPGPVGLEAETKLDEQISQPIVERPIIRSENDLRQALIGVKAPEREASEPEEPSIPPQLSMDDLVRENIQIKLEVEECRCRIGQITREVAILRKEYWNMEFLLREAEVGSVSGPSEVISDGYLQLKGSGYECYSLRVAEGKQVTIKIGVEDEGSIGFYILGEETFSKWKQKEPIPDAYVSQDLIDWDTIKWIPPRPDKYFFLFDNTRSQEKKKCKVRVLLSNLAPVEPKE